MKMTYKFFDTCSLLLRENNLFEDIDYSVVISTTSLQELENIKTSSNKDAETKYKARKLLHLLSENKDKYEVYPFTEEMLKPIVDHNFEINNDMKILAAAIDYDTKIHPDETVFVTNDLALQQFANLFFGEDSIESVNEEDPEQYTGYKIIQLTDEQFNDLYTNRNYNHFNCYINEYVLLQNNESEIVDRLCWTGEEYRPIRYKPFNSKWFGKISAYNNDIYQQLAIDCMYHNQLTVLRGGAGVGKSLLGFTYLFSLMEKSELNKIYIFCNPVATRDSAKLGFYPGDKNVKLLDSQIGNFLVSKLGDYGMVEELIDRGKLVLVPASDCRGMDIDNDAGIYITEAQNTTIDLMKLLVQRIGTRTKCIIEGDDYAQTDLVSYAGSNNGLRRLSQVFRGQDYYGEVTLQNCYRSMIAARAEQM